MVGNDCQQAFTRRQYSTLSVYADVLVCSLSVVMKFGPHLDSDWGKLRFLDAL